jgi:hypothetical protein
MIQVARIAVLSIAVVALCASMVAPVPVLAGTGTGSAQGTTTTPAWLQRLNSVRVAAGVATLDRALGYRSAAEEAARAPARSLQDHPYVSQAA